MVSETDLYSSIDVPILHKDWHGKYALSSVFLNLKLMGDESFVFHTYLYETYSILRSMWPSFVGLELLVGRHFMNGKSPD